MDYLRILRQAARTMECEVERVLALRPDEISERVGELQRMTTFEHQPIALRG